MKTAGLLFLLILFTCTTYTNGQIVSAGTGDWSGDTTWIGGVVPGAGDNVVISSGHTVTINIPDAACNDLTVGGYLYFGLTTGMGITINGDAVIENSGRFRMVSSTPGAPIIYQSIDFKKNLTVNSGGTFDMRQTSGSNGSVGRVVFSGTSNSVISLALSSYSSTTEEFNSVVINKTGGAKVILASGNLFQNNNSSNAADTLLFISGIIETGSNVWAHLATNSASIQGASSESYINGILGRGISNSSNDNVSRTFAVGDGSAYRPVGISVHAPANATGHYVWVKLTSGNANNGSSSFTGEIDKVSEDRYYEVGYTQGNGAASEMPFFRFEPSYSTDDGVNAGNTDLRVAYSTDNRATWVNAGPADHTTDLTDPPTFIESDSLDAAISLNTGTSLFVSLARLAGTTTNDIPVELTSFTAFAMGNNIELKWSTATESNNKGFEIERKSEGVWKNIGYVPGFGTTTEKKSYSYIDKNVSVGFYTYRLKQIDLDGSYKYSDEVNAEINSPSEYEMLQNYPNPFNPSTKINFTLAKEGKVKLTVINPIGQTVQILAEGFMEAGNHNITFDAKNLESGVYFYRLEAGDFTKTMKMLMIK